MCIRDSTHCGSLIPERETIERGILIALAMLQRYGDGLVAVMFDVQSPEEACRQAEAQ